MVSNWAWFGQVKLRNKLSHQFPAFSFLILRFEDTQIRNVLNYTIFIKNDIEFKKFHRRRYILIFDYVSTPCSLLIHLKLPSRNILRNITNKYISQCSYNKEKGLFKIFKFCLYLYKNEKVKNKDPFCPVFRVNDILNEAEPDEKQKYQMLIKVVKI